MEGLAGAKAGQRQGRMPEQWRLPGWSKTRQAGYGVGRACECVEGSFCLRPGSGGAEARGPEEGGAGSRAAHLSPTTQPPSILPACFPPPTHPSLCVRSTSVPRSPYLLAISLLKVSPGLFGNPCLSFLHLSLSLCLHHLDSDFHTDPSISPSLCLSLPPSPPPLPPEGCASVSRLPRLFWSLSFLERLSPSRLIDLPGLRRWLRGAWVRGVGDEMGMGFPRRRGGDTPPSATRETRVPVTCRPRRWLQADGPDVGAPRRAFVSLGPRRLIRLREGPVPIHGCAAASPPAAPRSPPESRPLKRLQRPASRTPPRQPSRLCARRLGARRGPEPSRENPETGAHGPHARKGFP